MTNAPAPARSAARAKLDQVCADAVDVAREAVTEDVAGAHLEVVAEGERLVTHYFECTMSGYRGWRWAVTVARTSRSKSVTICETVLLPGPDALTTPDWIPWNERVQPGDLGVGDLMPTAPDDDRLAPGYLLSDDPAVEDVSWELGLGRVRVLSREGRLDTAERWYEGEAGPQAPIATAAPANARCVSCGFYLPLAGSMRALFGACANVYAPDDGRIVSADHGCGAHSEVLVEQAVEVDEAPTVYDDAQVETVTTVRDSEPEAAAEPRAAEPAEAEPDAAEPVDVPEPADVTEPADATEQVDVAEPTRTEPAAAVAEPVGVDTAEAEADAAAAVVEVGDMTSAEPADDEAVAEPTEVEAGPAVDGIPPAPVEAAAADEPAVDEPAADAVAVEPDVADDAQASGTGEVDVESAHGEPGGPDA